MFKNLTNQELVELFILKSGRNSAWMRNHRDGCYQITLEISELLADIHSENSRRPALLP